MKNSLAAAMLLMLSMSPASAYVQPMDEVTLAFCEETREILPDLFGSLSELLLEFEELQKEEHLSVNDRVRMIEISLALDDLQYEIKGRMTEAEGICTDEAMYNNDAI